MEAGDAILPRINRIAAMAEQIRLLGGAKSEHEVVTKVLTSLSDSYNKRFPASMVGREDVGGGTVENLIKLFVLYELESADALARIATRLGEEHRAAKRCRECKRHNHRVKDCYFATRPGDSSGSRRVRARRGEPFLGREEGHYAMDNSAAETPARKGQNRNEAPEYEMLAFFRPGVTFDEDMWLINNTASIHMTPYEKYFATLDRTHRAPVNFFTGVPIMSEGMGDVVIMTGKGKTTIKNVLFVPGIIGNVLSVGQMERSGYAVDMRSHVCVIKDCTGKLSGETRRDGDRGFCLRLKVI
ncbi:unnamed protein product [Thlaspi arvense]|uniref:Retrovirus-related Pol polyprotein from transposon TNT 1-94-like beta-barrel domain-containing protein n=1 Tax=Thlaspi arvense TaxID=13288 RepID=A0AAU9RXJ7_THLAR|nr:unnamed protein product [Thlaspi arvense]